MAKWTGVQMADWLMAEWPSGRIGQVAELAKWPKDNAQHESDRMARLAQWRKGPGLNGPSGRVVEWAESSGQVTENRLAQWRNGQVRLAVTSG